MTDHAATVPDPETKAGQRFEQALWYAFGRLDAGEDVGPWTAFEFALYASNQIEELEAGARSYGGSINVQWNEWKAQR